MLGLCIRYYNHNYGGILQSYAMMIVLKEIGIDFKILNYKKNKNIFYELRQIPRLFNTILVNDKKEKFLKKIGMILHPTIKQKNKIRDDCLNNFINEYFQNNVQMYDSYDSLKKHSIDYEIILTGSDQLWSPAGLPTNFYNLNFCESCVKRVSYASSFGVKKIPWYQKKRTKSYLLKMSQISMREISGVHIVKQLINKDVSLVVDPVFLLSKNEWNKYIIPKSPFNGEFIFAYFLGNNKEYRKQVSLFAKRYNLPIITMRHLDQYVPSDEEFGDYAPYDVSPNTFLNYIRYAKYIFTDSFHGTVFSIIFHKKFLTFYRYNCNSKVSKNTRIDSLFDMLKLDRMFNYNIDKIKEDINYNVVDDLLNKWIAFSMNYLKNALRG